MTRTTSSIFVLMLAVGCGSDLKPPATLCEPLAAETCYAGPPSAGGVGACSLGSAVCSADGSGHGECLGSVLPSFQGCATGVDTNCDGAAACSGEHRWSQGLIGQGYKHPIGLSVDNDGNIFIAGEFEGTIDLGGGELKADASLMMRDVFVAKYDAAGKHLWSKSIGDAADQTVFGVASDPGGNVILTGHSETPIEFEGEALSGLFTLKLGPGGEVVWSLPRGGNMRVDRDGNILFAGGFIEPLTIGDTTLTSAGGRDIFIAKFDPSGAFLWAVSAGGEGAEYLHTIAVDGAGHIAVAGQYTGVADLGGGPFPPGAPDSNENAFAAKFDKNGAFLWSRSFVGPYVRVRTLSADSAGRTVVSGLVNGPVDFGGGQVLSDSYAGFLTKIDQSGSTLFTKSYVGNDASGAPWAADVASVAFDSEDNMLVLGSFDVSTTLDGPTPLKATGVAVFVAKYDALGKIIWGLTPGGGAAYDKSGGIGADPMGNVVVTGLYDSGMDFGGGILYGNPQQDEIFLAKLAP